MSNMSDKVNALAEKALDYRSARGKLIAGNIANEDTPFYKARDINFSKMLQDEAHSIFQKNKNTPAKLELAATQGKYFKSSLEDKTDKPKLFYRGGHLSRNDGNNVDLDIETTEMTKNTMMFQTIIAGMKAKGKVMKAVIEASNRTA